MMAAEWADGGTAVIFHLGLAAVFAALAVTGLALATRRGPAPALAHLGRGLRLLATTLVLATVVYHRPILRLLVWAALGLLLAVLVREVI